MRPRSSATISSTFFCLSAILELRRLQRANSRKTQR
jgi:hypothetical protein